MKRSSVKVCSICGKTYVGYGNNAEPINNGRCCDECNSERVIPERIMRFFLDMTNDK